jgi:hypothetical protein
MTPIKTKEDTQLIRPDIFGYFNSPEDEIPAHDPGTNTVCPICTNKLSPPLKTISIMKRHDIKSYFYRTHKACYESISQDEITNIESSLIDSL